MTDRSIVRPHRRPARLRRLAGAALASAGLATLGAAVLAAPAPTADAATALEGPRLAPSAAASAAAPVPTGLGASVDDGERALRPLPAPTGRDGVTDLRVVTTPVPAAPRPTGDARSGLPAADAPEGDCPPVVASHTDADFTGGSFVAQAGFVESEIAAASYTLAPGDFPIRLDLAEMIFVTSNATVETTTEWSLLVWQGTPVDGTIVAEVSSDGELLPHIVMPPGTSGVNVQVLVDPDDPEQIVIQDDGSATFTIGYRIDAHNQPSPQPCLIGPDPCCNAFPATDTGGLQEPTRNWLRGIDCGFLGCPPGGGWTTFADLNPLCRPSGDWVIRATWSSLDCTSGPAGACCLPDGTCDVLTAAACESAGGIYFGDGVLCGEVTCPDPVGACCLGTTCAVGSEADCDDIGGVFLGLGTDCADDACSAPGACCIPATGGCLTLAPDDCEAVGGIFQGPATRCADVICFPEGACCLPSGDCLDGVSPEDCGAVGGTFQGDGTACGTVECPEPIGACCLQDGAVCLELTEADCTIVAGTWAGPATTCTDGDGDGTADDCTACPPDLDGSGAIDFGDILSVLSAWGACGDPCPEDLDGSAAVDFDDLLTVLGAFGPC